MSEAPERIWADMDGCWWDKPYGESPEYVRCDMLQEIFARYSRVEADRIEELEAKLAKAAEALQGLVPILCEGFEDGCGKLSRHYCAACEGYATLAELTGGKDD